MARTYQVFLNIYDVQAGNGNEGMTSFISKVNKIGRDLGLGGVFHGAVQIENLEWSYGWCERGSGVYAVEARSNPMYQFRETISLGPTLKSKQEIKATLQRLKAEWQGNLYELLSKNCCHFCEAFCVELGVQPPPAWVNRLASSADATVAFTNEAVAVARSAATSIQRGASWLRDNMGRMLTRSSNSGLSGTGNSRPHSSTGALHSQSASPEPRERLLDAATRRCSRDSPRAGDLGPHLHAGEHAGSLVDRSCGSCSSLSPRREARGTQRMRGFAVQRLAHSTPGGQEELQGPAQEAQPLLLEQQHARPRGLGGGQPLLWADAAHAAGVYQHEHGAEMYDRDCRMGVLRRSGGPLGRQSGDGQSLHGVVSDSEPEQDEDEDEEGIMATARQLLSSKSFTRQTCLDLSADGSDPALHEPHVKGHRGIHTSSSDGSEGGSSSSSHPHSGSAAVGASRHSSTELQGQATASSLQQSPLATQCQVTDLLHMHEQHWPASSSGPGCSAGAHTKQPLQHHGHATAGALTQHGASLGVKAGPAVGPLGAGAAAAAGKVRGAAAAPPAAVSTLPLP